MCMCVFCLHVYGFEPQSVSGLSRWITILLSCLNNLGDPSNNCGPLSTPPLTTRDPQEKYSGLWLEAL